MSSANCRALLYSLETKNGNKTLFEAPTEITGIDSSQRLKNSLNIVMVDVSGSMSGDWDNIEKYWNEVVADTLLGTVKH